jgi:PAS domain S-box-containing protein
MNAHQRFDPSSSSEDSTPAAVAEGLSADFRALFDATPTPLLVLQPPDWRIVAVNDAYLQATMTRREELLGRLLFDAFPDDPDDPQASGVSQLDASLRRVLATGHTDTMPLQRYPIRRPAAQGGGFVERWWSPVNVPVPGPDGAVALVLHRVEDLSFIVRSRGGPGDVQPLARGQQALVDRLWFETLATTRAQEARRTSEQRFRTVVDLVPDLLWSNQPDGRVDWFNQRWSEYTGLDDSEALGDGWMAAIHPDDLPTTRVLWRQSLRSGKAVVHEHRIRRHDGQYRWHLLRTQPVRDAQGRIERWFGSATDVHDQRIARDLLERRVQQRTGELRMVLNNAASAIVATDLAGRITTLNPAAEALLRLPAVQATGRPVLDFIDRRTLRRRIHGLPQEVRRALRPRSEPHARRWPAVPGGEWRCVRADGSGFPALVNVSVLRDEQDQATGFLGVVTDLSERKRLELALRQRTAQAEAANRAKSTFLAHMSHEFRTPLNAVIGLSHLLARMELPERAGSFVRHIEQAGAQLLALIDDVLDLSRIEAGEMRLEQVRFNLPELLEGAVVMVRPQAEAKKLALRLDAAPGLPVELLGDPLRLKQVLINLLGNAVKFTAQGSVTLRVRELAHAGMHSKLRFDVMDTGIGMAPEAQQRIFEPFIQADGSITRRYGGSGLGLSIVQRLVDMMGGTLELASSPGLGSTFSVTVTLTVDGAGSRTGDRIEAL